MTNIPKEILEKLIKLRYEDRRTQTILCDESDIQEEFFIHFYDILK